MIIINKQKAKMSYLNNKHLNELENLLDRSRKQVSDLTEMLKHSQQQTDDLLDIISDLQRENLNLKSQ